MSRGWWEQWAGLPCWDGGVPRFTSNADWAEILRVSLSRVGYTVTLKSCPQAVRCRIAGPEGEYGCKTIWLDQWPGPELAGPVVLGLAVYHALYGAEMLGHVEGLLAA